jgi:hypothetical protein
MPTTCQLLTDPNSRIARAARPRRGWQHAKCGDEARHVRRAEKPEG